MATISFARTADTNAYTANDVVGPATGSSAAQFIPQLSVLGAGEVIITSVQLRVDVAAIPGGMSNFRLYLYSGTPPSALGDNAAWDIPAGDRSVFLGYVDLGAPVDLGSTLYVEANSVNKQVALTGYGVYGYLVTTGAYTPGSGDVFTITVHAAAL